MQIDKETAKAEIELIKRAGYRNVRLTEREYGDLYTATGKTGRIVVAYAPLSQVDRARLEASCQ